MAARVNAWPCAASCSIPASQTQEGRWIFKDDISRGVKGTKRLRNMSVERQSVVQGLMYHLLCKAQNIYI